MKKTLIAVAALAATASFAQVSVYGRLDAGYGAYTTTSAAGADTKRNGVSSHNSVSSMWGIKGSEDLGGGLKAFFVLEQDVYTANGNTGASGAAHGATSNGAFDRTSLVGVEGAFGKVAFGRDYTPMFKLIGSSDIHALSNLSTVQSATAAGGSTLPNMIMYSTPNLSGFVGNLSLINTDTSTAVSVDKIEGNNLTAVYNNGPLMVGAGVGTHKVTAAGVESKTEATALSAAYNFGTFALRGGWTSSKVNAGDANTEMNLGATMPLGKVTLGLQVGSQDVKVAAAPAATGTGTDMVISADYALSAKTALYAKTGTVNKVGDNQKTTGTALGIKTVF